MKALAMETETLRDQGTLHLRNAQVELVLREQDGPVPAAGGSADTAGPCEPSSAMSVISAKIQRLGITRNNIRKVGRITPARSARWLAGVLSLLGPGLAATQGAADNRFEKDIQAYEARDRQAFPPTNEIVCVGSSTFAWWHTMAKDLAPFTVIPRGFGGSTMAEALLHVDRIVTPYQPRIVLVYEGGNDVAGGTSPAAVMDDAKKLVARIRAKGPETRVYFLAIRPSTARWYLASPEDEVGRLLLQFAESDDKVGFIDVRSPLLDEAGLADARWLAPDGLHLHRDGNIHLASLIKPWLWNAGEDAAGRPRLPTPLQRLHMTTAFRGLAFRGPWNGTLELPVENTSDKPILFAGQWQRTDESGAVVEPASVTSIEVAAGATRVFTFTCQTRAGTFANPYLAWTATQGAETVRGGAAVTLFAQGGYLKNGKGKADRATLTIDAAEQVKSFGRAPWGGPVDCSGSALLNHDDTGLRIVADVRDDVFSGGAPYAWENDAVEVTLDVRPDASGPRSHRDDGTFQIIAVPAAVNGGAPRLMMLQGEREVAIEGIKAMSDVKEQGFRLELLVPWAGLKQRYPALDRDAIHFNWCIDDADEGAKLKQQLRWAGVAADHLTPGLWGHLHPAGE